MTSLPLVKDDDTVAQIARDKKNQCRHYGWTGTSHEMSSKEHAQNAGNRQY
jgi:acetate kinase